MTTSRSLTRWIMLAAMTLAALLLAFSTAARPAEAAFPGDNGRIAYESGGNFGEPSAEREILSVQPDSSDEQPITDNEADDSSVSYSPDGGKVVFDRGTGLDSEIVIANAEGSDEAVLTNNEISETNPAFSPNGEKIVFTREEAGGDRELYTMNVDGSEQVQITEGDGTGDAVDDGATWSPNGETIACREES